MSKNLRWISSLLGAICFFGVAATSAVGQVQGDDQVLIEKRMNFEYQDHPKGVTSQGWGGVGPVVELSAQTSTEVENDRMRVDLTAIAEGQDIGQLNQRVLELLNNGLARAKKSGQISARMGYMSTNPKHGPDGQANGWSVSGSIVLTSQYFDTLGRLAANLGKDLQISGVSYYLSADGRYQAQRKLMPELASRFLAAASDEGIAFGLGRHRVSRLTVTADTPPPVYPRPMPMVASRAMSAPIPSDGGSTVITVSAQGTVQYIK